MTNPWDGHISAETEQEACGYIFEHADETDSYVHAWRDGHDRLEFAHMLLPNGRMLTAERYEESQRVFSIEECASWLADA